MRLFEKYLITETSDYKMKEYLKTRMLEVRKNGKVWAINKKNKSDKDVFKNDKELRDYVEKSWSPAKGGLQNTQY